jgi:hypothetical protein
MVFSKVAATGFVDALLYAFPQRDVVLPVTSLNQ